jgi:hypothetical protein
MTQKRYWLWIENEIFYTKYRVYKNKEKNITIIKVISYTSIL